MGAGCMSENKPEYVVEYRRAADVLWRESFRSKDKTEAEKHLASDRKRFLTFQLRLIQVKVLKELR
jgi:hypothetical protein